MGQLFMGIYRTIIIVNNWHLYNSDDIFIPFGENHKKNTAHNPNSKPSFFFFAMIQVRQNNFKWVVKNQFRANGGSWQGGIPSVKLRGVSSSFRCFTYAIIPP